MPAPSPSLVVKDPPPLNALTLYPYQIDEFPAATLLGGLLGNLAPREEPTDAPAVAGRKEQR